MCDKERFDIAVEIRNFEIELFWKRSLFFWGFISSAFIGYAALHKSNSDLSLIIACFGMVCSFAWTLLNRGSKYWQESWETKVERFDTKDSEGFFAKEELSQDKGWWLSARKFSVSKLTIALSDYIFLLWLSIIVAEILSRLLPDCSSSLRNNEITLFVIFSFIYLILLFCFGRKSSNNEANQTSRETHSHE